MGKYANYQDALNSFNTTERKTQVITTTNIQLPADRSSEAIRHDIEFGVGYDYHRVTSPIQVAALFACARVIAEGLAQVPCLLQRNTPDKGHQNAVDHPLFRLLARSPNSFQTSFEFREWLGLQLALTGNAFVWVSRNPLGQPIELIPLAQHSVTVLTNTFGEVAYRLNVTGQPAYTQKNIWHLKGASWDGASGLNPQWLAANAIALAGDLEMFGSQLFRNGSRPSGLLTTEQVLSKAQQLELMEAWHLQNSGISNAHKTAVISNGLKFQQMQTNANDAQFIESRRYETEEICRVMRVDPLMIQQATNSAAYASVEQRFLSHLQNTLGPWFERFTQSVEANLLTRVEQESFRCHLDTRALLRTNAIDQSSYINTMVTAGVMTRNEGRELAGMDRVNDPAADKLTPAANLFGGNGQPQEPTS